MIAVGILALLVAAANAGIPSFPFKGELPPNYSPKIILGGDAPAGQFPYIVSINYDSTDGHSCGASVLTETAILTAAHCCQVDAEEYIYAGSQKLSSGGSRYEIKSRKVHEKYIGGDNYYQNDICIITLKSPLKLGSTIAKVKLPSADLEVPDGGLVTIIGWGYTDPFDHVVPDVLQIGKNYVALSQKKCQAATQVPAFVGEICATGASAGEGVCNGDSGSPLTYNGVQVGIASFIFTPCGSSAPDFYSYVPNYISWIQQQLGEDAANLVFA